MYIKELKHINLCMFCPFAGQIGHKKDSFTFTKMKILSFCFNRNVRGFSAARCVGEFAGYNRAIDGDMMCFSWSSGGLQRRKMRVEMCPVWRGMSVLIGLDMS